MENKRRDGNVKHNKTGGFFTKLFAHTGGNPEDIEDQEWYLDSPDIRLTRIFSVVLVLHIVAIGGILAFKMIDKASGSGGQVLAKAQRTTSTGGASEKVAAGRIGEDAVAGVDTSVPDLRVGPDRYRVIEGDTLSEIAVKLGVSSDVLRLTNGITSPDEISPGMLLTVPAPSFMSPAHSMDYDQLPESPNSNVVATEADQMKPSPKESLAIRKAPDDAIVYLVQKGDTAWGISQKLGIHHTVILEHNGIAKPELLQEGQLLSIPSKE